MKSGTKLLSVMKSPPDNITDEVQDQFFKEFYQWIHSLSENNTGKKESHSTKRLISDCLSAISNICTQRPTKILKNFKDLSEILTLLLSVYNDPELRVISWNHTINIINALCKSIEYTEWENVINSAFNYDRNHDRINIGSSPEFVAKTYMDQTNSILQQCSLNQPIQYYYWLLIYSKYINTRSFKFHPSARLAVESLYSFINILKQSFELDNGFPNPLQPIPTFTNGSIVNKFSPDLASSFLHAFVFVQNQVSKSSKDLIKITQAMKIFLNSAFQYWTFIVTNDQEIINNPQLILSVTTYLPQPQTQETLNTIAKHSKIYEELIDICILVFNPLYNAIEDAKDKQKAMLELTDHIYLTRMIVAQLCKRIKDPKPLIYFSNHAANKFSKKLIPIYSNLIFAILVDVSSDNTDSVVIITPEVYHYITTDLTLIMEFHNAAPTLNELFDFYSSFLACSFAVDLLNIKLTDEHYYDLSKNPIIFDFKMIRKSLPRTDWKKRFLYIPQANVGFQRSSNFVMQFMNAFCKLLSYDFLITFVSTLLEIYEFYKDQTLNASFICQDALGALLKASGSSSKILALADRIFSANLGEVPLESRLRFAARLRREVAGQGQGFKKAFSIATNWVMDGGDGCLALLATLANKLPSLRLTNISDDDIYNIGQMIVSAFSVFGDRPEFSNLIDSAATFLTDVIASDQPIVRREEIFTETLVGILLVATERGQEIKSDQLETLVMNWTRTQVNNLSLYAIVARRYNSLPIAGILMTALNTLVVGHRLSDPQMFTTARIFGDILSEAYVFPTPPPKALMRKAESESKSMQFFENAFGHLSAAPQYDFALANSGKQSGVIQEISYDANTFYAREDMLLVMLIENGLFGSSVFGSFCYTVSKPLPFLLSAVDTAGLFFHKTMGSNRYVSLAKHFAHRTQRKLIIVSVIIGKGEEKKFQGLLGALGTRTLSKNLPLEITHKFKSEIVYLRRTNRADIVFDTDCDYDAHIALALGSCDAGRAELVISARLLTGGAVAFRTQAAHQLSGSPLAERKILSRRDAPVFIMEAVLQAGTHQPDDRGARVRDFKQSWSFIAQSWL